MPDTEAASFELVAGNLVLDLVNTLDNRFVPRRQKELLNDFEDLVRLAEESGILSEAKARRVIRTVSDEEADAALELVRGVRESFANLFYEIVTVRRAVADGREAGAVPNPDRVRWVSMIFKNSFTLSELRWTDPAALEPGKKGVAREWAKRSPRLQWVWTGLTAESVVYPFIFSALELLTSDDLAMVQYCDNPKCRWLFLDKSKNHTRRWCDMRTCGNRMKARRYKSRR